MTLFKKGTEVNNIYSDKNGRINVDAVEIGSEQYTCINVYAPTNENEKVLFFNELSAMMMTKLNRKNIILAGDFNVTLEKEDKKFGNYTPSNSAETLKQLLQTHHLVDIWRHRHPNKKMYTWSRNHPKIMCRLDYFFISHDKADFCSKSKIVESIKSDHKLIYLEIDQIHKNKPRGRGFYKFNNSLLEDKHFRNLIINLIADKAEELDDIEDKRTMWDYLKFEIQNLSIEYSIKKAKARRKLENEILDKCESLYSKLCDLGLNQEEEQAYAEYKCILEDLNHYKEKGAYIRSRTEFIEQNEKSNKFFYNKERESFEKKTVDKLNIEGNIVSDEKEILSQLKLYYFNLYGSTNPQLQTVEFENMLNVEGLQTLDEENKEYCEGVITYNECVKALQRMQNGKSPGCDGLTVDFYKTFWPVIGHILVEVLNSSFQKRELSQSQRTAVIILLQKKGKDSKLIKNWRPVSLTNVDYKILTK